MLLFYIRHGDPNYEPNELTPLGVRQAEALARRLSRYGLDELYVSSSERARETAAPTEQLLKKQAVMLDWLNEDYAYREQSVPTEDGGSCWAFFRQDYIDLLTSREIRDLAGKWYEHPAFSGTDFAKGHLRLRREAREFLDNLGWEWDEERGQYRNRNYEASEPEPYKPEVKTAAFMRDKRVAVFAHHGVGTNFLSAVLDIPYPEICLKTNIGHTGLSVIYFDDAKHYAVPQLLTLSDDGHLLMENMPTAYNNAIYF